MEGFVKQQHEHVSEHFYEGQVLAMNDELRSENVAEVLTIVVVRGALPQTEIHLLVVFNCFN